MMPIALIEAAASGLPCLTHDHPTMRWMTGAGGVQLDMSESGRLTAVIEQLTLDEPKRAMISKAARVHALNEFSSERVVSEIQQYYHMVHSHRGHRS
jgi:glycosyltransferase involved in cell wall biosynthesis